MIKIAVINEFDGLTDSDIRPVVKALNFQVKKHFAPVWGVEAELYMPKPGIAPQPEHWQLVILDNAHQAGIYGYHELTSHGQPLGKVFAGTDLRDGSSWTVTASHEVLEMLIDPSINLSAFVPQKKGPGVLYGYEVCDACQADEFGYTIRVGKQDVLVSDFVYPGWFEDFHRRGTQYDYQKKVTQPFQLLKGGYISVYDIGKHHHRWTIKAAKLKGKNFRVREDPGTRRAQRRLPKKQWRKSITPGIRVGKIKNGKIAA